MLDPGERQGQRQSLESVRKLRDERACHRRVGSRHVRGNQDEALRILHRHGRHFLRPGGGTVALDARAGDPRAHAPKVFDERQAQHDGNRPQFAQLEGRHRLVGRNEATEALGIHAAIPVRDRLQRNIVDARQARRGAAAQAGQLSAVASRQMPPGSANLLFDEIEIVEQPFPRRDDAAIGRQRLGQQPASFDQDSFVVGESCQQAIGGPARRQLVRGGQEPPVLLHLVVAEQFGAQR